MIVDKKDNIVINLTQNAYLRQLGVEDITQDYISGLNDKLVNRFLIGPRNKYQTINSVSDFIRENNESATCLLFGLFVDNVFSGTTRIHDITKDEAYVGLAIFKKELWGQGWGEKIIQAIRKFSCCEFKITKIKAGIEFDNVASQKVFLASGFVIDDSYSGKNKNIYIYHCQNKDS